MINWFPAGLKDLASRLNEPLYLVGGSVRNHLMGKPVGDFDVASSLSERELCACLEGAPFKIVPTSPKLGTLKIKGEDFSAEYTAFRVDSYALDGGHAPASVSFVKDIRLDAFRRDFTVNAIYYDIASGEYVDPTGGIPDLKTGVLRTVRNADAVFQEDGLRLMRFVRFASTYGFQPDPTSVESLIKCRAGLGKIAPERIQTELNLILTADVVGGIPSAHRRGVEMLVEYGLMDYVIPELNEGLGVAQHSIFHKYDVFGHVMATLEAVDPSARLGALFHDIAKPKCYRETGKFRTHDKAGGKMTREILTRLKYSHRETEETARLVEGHMFNLKGGESEYSVRRYVRDNRDILEKLCYLMDADAIGGGIGTTCSKVAIQLKATEKNLIAEGAPFTVKDLKVRGEDLIAAGIPPAERGKAMEALLDAALGESSAHTREGQLKFLENFSSKNGGAAE